MSPCVWALTTPPINPVAFELGPFQIKWYAIIIIVGILVAERVIQREANRFGYDSELISDLLLPALVVGGIGARAYYVLFRLDYYLANPGEIIAIWHGGIAIYGFIIGFVLALYGLSKRKGLNFTFVMDLFAPGILSAQAIGRWANFTNQEAHGGAVSRQFLERLHLPHWLIEQMYIDGVYYQPTFLYESVWSAIGVALLLWLRSKAHCLRQGEIFLLYLIWYGCGRFWIEGLRTDSLYWGHLRVSQWLSLVIVLVGTGIFIYRRRQHEMPYYSEGRVDIV